MGASPPDHPCVEASAMNAPMAVLRPLMPVQFAVKEGQRNCLRMLACYLCCLDDAEPITRFH